MSKSGGSSSSSSSMGSNPPLPPHERSSARGVEGNDSTPLTSAATSHQQERATAGSHECSNPERTTTIRRPPINVPGSSAFSPYIAAPPPPPTSIGGSSGTLVPFASLPVSVGSSRDISISPAGGVRKRIRDADPLADGNPCSVCGKWFATPKALFGHMRSHPNRGWKGAHPPPTFRAEDEFVDLVNRPQRVPSAAHEDVGGGEQVQPPHNEDHDQDQGEPAADGPRVYKLPDLNNSPPSDTDH